MQKEIAAFYEDYLARLKAIDAEEQELLSAGTKKVWTQHLVRKSALVRESHQIIENSVEKYIKPYVSGTRKMNAEVADTLRKGAMHYFSGSFFDELMSSSVLEKLTAYYSAKGDSFYERMCRFGFANHAYLSVGNAYCPNALKEAEKVFENMDSLREIRKQHTSEKTFLQDVSFVMETGFRLFDCECKQFEPDVEKLIFIFNRLAKFDTYEDILPKAFYEEWHARIHNLLGIQLIFTQTLHWDSLSEKRRSKLKPLLEGVLSKQLNLPSEQRNPRQYMAFILYCFYSGKYSPDECFNMLYSYTLELADINDFSSGSWYSYDGNNRFYAICTTTRPLLQMVLSSRMSEQQKNQKVASILYDVKSYIEKIPRECAGRENMDHCLYHLLYDIIEFIDDEAMAIEFMESLMMNRQLSTLIHSVMTAKLTQAVMDPLVDKHPEWFREMLEVETDEEVLAKKEDLALFVYNAARCHDVGKIRIATVVNTQIRTISDVEYTLIKNHPRWSYDILVRNPLLAPYADIALGHHKSYDDESGYPNDCRHKESKYRFLTDLLKICDSIDAATDTFGRNYQRGKSFEKVFAEIEAVKETKYNPDIISFIREDEKLFAQLKEITSREARGDFYYHIYRKFR